MEDEILYEQTDKPDQVKQSASYPDRLSAVNATLQFTNIKGKYYAQVNQRILAFWALFPEGSIVSKKASDDGTRCDFVACVYRTKEERENDMPAVIAHAYEDKGRGVNSTSYVENCETSAIGRALGMLGIGATTSIASAEEVLQAMGQQEAQQVDVPATEQPAQNDLVFSCENCGTTYQFQTIDQYRGWVANATCCANPKWPVV